MVLRSLQEIVAWGGNTKTSPTITTLSRPGGNGVTRQNGGLQETKLELGGACLITFKLPHFCMGMSNASSSFAASFCFHFCPLLYDSRKYTENDQ